MARLLAPLIARRTRAYLRDCLGYLGVAAALLPIGIPIALSIESPGTARLVGLVTSVIPPVIAAVWAARAESGTAAATWGKRREGLRVEGLRVEGLRVEMISGTPAEGVDGARRIPFPRALVRNLVKIAIPWQLGHAVAVGAAFGDFETGAPGTLVVTVVLYAYVIVLGCGVVLGSGHGMHDRLAGSRVVGARG